MKKIIILSIITIGLLITSCNSIKSIGDYIDIEELEVKQKQVDEIESISSFGTRRSSISFEDAVLNSYLIIEANLKSIEPNIVDFPENQKAQTGQNYIYNEISVIKGQYLDSEINITISNEVIDSLTSQGFALNNIGEKHYLVLCRKYSVYWDKDMYIPYNYVLVKDSKGMINVCSTNGEKTKEKFNKDTFKGLVNEIIVKNKSKQTNVANWGVEYTNSKDISEISEFSNLVVEVRPKEVIVDGGNTLFVKCELINLFKGEFDKTKKIIFLAEGFDINQKYLLLLSDQPGSYFLSSKNSCIPISDTETYEEYMKHIVD